MYNLKDFLKLHNHHCLGPFGVQAYHYDFSECGYAPIQLLFFKPPIKLCYSLRRYVGIAKSPCLYKNYFIRSDNDKLLWPGYHDHFSPIYYCYDYE